MFGFFLDGKKVRVGGGTSLDFFHVADGECSSRRFRN
jgi:hypothetical protein